MQCHNHSVRFSASPYAMSDISGKRVHPETLGPRCDGGGDEENTISMEFCPQVFRPLELGFSDPESRGWSGTHAVKCNLGPDEDEESSCEQNLFGGGNPIHSCRLAWMSMFNQGSTTSTGCGDPLATPATI